MHGQDNIQEDMIGLSVYVDAVQNMTVISSQMGRIGSESSDWFVYVKYFYSDQAFFSDY